MPLEEIFRIEGHELVMRIPPGGIDPSWLASPLAELKVPPSAGVSALHVEAPDDWRWGSVEAAFPARILDELRKERREPAQLKARF